MQSRKRVLAICAVATMPGSQVTQLEHHMNELVVVIFVVLVAVAMLCSLANDSFLRRRNATAWYMWTEGCGPLTAPSPGRPFYRTQRNTQGRHGD